MMGKNTIMYERLFFLAKCSLDIILAEQQNGADRLGEARWFRG
jgi:hypothetical protein